MIIRRVMEKDVENFYRMMCLLDEETEFMMYEPGERQTRTKDLNRLQTIIHEAASGEDLMLVAENDGGEIVGFLHAQRGKRNRIMHTADIVVGIREAYRRQGIGSEFFQRLDDWAQENGIIRLELTVECENIAAKNLYEKAGFKVEGIRKKSMKIGSRFVDEYYVGKIMV